MVALLLLLGQRQRDAESRPLARPVAVHVDLSAVIGDDAIGDRQPQPGPLPVAAAREERLEQVLAALRRSCRSRCR